MPTQRLPIANKMVKRQEKASLALTPTHQETGAPKDVAEPEIAELTRQLQLYRREWQELIERIKLSRHFRNTDKAKLLDWVWSRFPNKTAVLDVEIEFFANRESPQTIEPSRSRVAWADLRGRLSEFAKEERGEKWLLNGTIGTGGYRLDFVPSNRSSSASQAFWNVHLRSFENPILITGSHLFFFETDTNKIIRYYDFNVKGEPDSDEIMQAFRLAYPTEPALSKREGKLEPWRDVYRASGDIATHDLLLRWFHRESDSKILIERCTSRAATTSELHRKNAILIGRPQTNPLIETLMKADPQKTRFAFQIHPLKGALQVSNIDIDEIPELSGFPISPDGVVGPVPTQKKVFGVFTRFPNPGGRGYITIISCGHYAMVIARIVEAITDKSHAKELLAQMGWVASEPLPDAFEMLFTVDIAPGGLEGEGFPKMIAWRRC